MNERPASYMRSGARFEIIARVAYAANVEYSSRVDNFAHKPWDEIDEALRETTRQGVRFRLENPSATPESMHENWLKEKKAAGYVYGERKDDVAKTHPDCVPYDELPEDQKRKNRLFSAIVDALK